MKKSLIALAVLAASGAAMAQSTVTLYGVADAYFGQTKTGLDTVANPEVTQTVLSSGGVNGSRWGLKGSEDLGGGLKADFVLEQGFNIDNGAQADATSLFNRQAYVGLSGGFGAVTAGRQYSAYDALRGATNNTYDSAIATTGTVWGYGAVADYTSRINNSIQYSSPVFGGFSGAVQVGLGENKTAAVDAGRTVSLHVKYAAGPILVGYAHQAQKAQNGIAASTSATTGVFTPAVAATGTDTTKYNMIAGSYDFGVAKLLAGYNRAELGNAKDNEYQLGVNVPVGPAASVALGYTRTKGEVNGTTTRKGTGYSLAGYYDLSKRTALYAGYNRTTQDNDAGTDLNKTSLLAVGVRHKF